MNLMCDHCGKIYDTDEHQWCPHCGDVDHYSDNDVDFLHIHDLEREDIWE